VARLSGALAVGYRNLLERALERPRLTLAILIAGLSVLAGLGLTLRRDFFSPVQRDQFVVDVFARQGSALAYTSEVVADIEVVLAEESRIVGTASFVGRNAPLIFYNLESQETYANHFAQLIVQVDDWRHTARVARDVQNILQSRISGAECVVHILEHGAPYVAPFEVRIGGPSIPTLRELGHRAAEQLQRSPGVRNVRTNYGNLSPKVVAQVNELVARRIGIDQGIVADELRHRLDGLVAGYMQEGDERIDILLRFPASGRQDIGDLGEVYFKPSSAAPSIPFSAVTTLVPKWEATSIYRRDGQRTLSVLAYPQFGLTPAEVSQDFAPWMAALGEQLPPGYSLQLGGENEQRHEAESNLLKNAVYAVLVIFLLLVAEFRSFRLTIMILALVPLSLGGTMAGLFLTRWPLNFMAMMGMIILIGVVVNDSLILVDGFERRRKQGQSIRRLVVSGSLERTRHVVITTITTTAGFLPLAISPSLLWPPLAIAIIGGLIVATLVTLVAVPVAYALLCRRLEVHPSSQEAELSPDAS
jgi:multidrug efflux pump subunit AcrB